MKKILLIAFLISFFCRSYAQVDTNYIHQYINDNKLNSKQLYVIAINVFDCEKCLGNFYSTLNQIQNKEEKDLAIVVSNIREVELENYFNKNFFKGFRKVNILKSNNFLTIGCKTIVSYFLDVKNDKIIYSDVLLNASSSGYLQKKETRNIQNKVLTDFALIKDSIILDEKNIIISSKNFTDSHDNTLVIYDLRKDYFLIYDKKNGKLKDSILFTYEYKKLLDIIQIKDTTTAIENEPMASAIGIKTASIQSIKIGQDDNLYCSMYLLVPLEMPSGKDTIDISYYGNSFLLRIGLKSKKIDFFSLYKQTNSSMDFTPSGFCYFDVNTNCLFTGSIPSVFDSSHTKTYFLERYNFTNDSFHLVKYLSHLNKFFIESKLFSNYNEIDFVIENNKIYAYNNILPYFYDIQNDKWLTFYDSTSYLKNKIIPFQPNNYFGFYIDKSFYSNSTFQFIITRGTHKYYEEYAALNTKPLKSTLIPSFLNKAKFFITPTCIEAFIMNDQRSVLYRLEK